MGRELEIYHNPDHIWFTSDTHFGHKNIIESCNRPFFSVEEMNEALICNWNKVVGKDDTVFHLGDFAWGRAENWFGALERLNGHIHLILGNHDDANLRPGYEKYFSSISYQKRIEIDGRTVYLNHYPFLTYGGVYRTEARGVWQMHGHVHSGHRNTIGRDLPLLVNRSPYQYDVGVDNNDFTPISFTTISEKISEQIKLYNNGDVYKQVWF